MTWQINDKFERLADDKMCLLPFGSMWGIILYGLFFEQLLQTNFPVVSDLHSQPVLFVFCFVFVGRKTIAVSYKKKKHYLSSMFSYSFKRWVGCESSSTPQSFLPA